MSRRPRKERKPVYYNCFLCSEKFNSNFMPCAIVNGHKICWTCKEIHKTYDTLSGMIEAKEIESSKAGTEDRQPWN